MCNSGSCEDSCSMCGKGHEGGNVSRRHFLAAAGGTSFAGAMALHPGSALAEKLGPVKPIGPGSKVVPKVKATFVRRRQPYGMWWPGAVYDGKTAKKKYTEALYAASEKLGMKVDLRNAPIYSKGEAKAWVEEAKAEKPDALLVLLLDRQQHSWPTAFMAAESGIPTIIHCPLGTSFTTNTRHLAGKKGCVICATDDFGEVAFALNMVRAHKKLQKMRFVLIRGNSRKKRSVLHLGTELQYVAASDFLSAWEDTPITGEMKKLAEEYLSSAYKLKSGSKKDIIQGIKSYFVVKKILEREEADGISMDCLGILANRKMSLPCIAWSYMLDHGIPAACEADVEACVTHALVQYLFERPGFQQDPVAETSRGTLIGAHCTCPTRLRGFDKPPVKYDIRHHHGNRDAVPRPVWEPGHKVTVADIWLSRKKENPPKMLISRGRVAENRSIPPAGGCVVSVELKLDGISDCLAYPGFHQIFFYGDFKRQLLSYCQLYNIEPVVLQNA